MRKSQVREVQSILDMLVKTYGEGVGRKIRPISKGGTVRVVVDWMAGTQSLGETVKLMDGVLYLPLDWQRNVYSAAQSRWVYNIEVDLMNMTEEGLWDLIQREARVRSGLPKAKVEIILLGMSPCCKTFSGMDHVNIPSGENYRNGKEDKFRRPKNRTSDKGKEAHHADIMVQKAQRVAGWMERELGVKF